MKASEKEPQTVEIRGHELSCPVCSNKNFWTREAMLNKAVSTFFNLDWTDRTATCFVCSECTHISWFLG
jgi:predicted nucleic-acid-binding Zn-ribbon protein